MPRQQVGVPAARWSTLARAPRRTSARPAKARGSRGARASPRGVEGAKPLGKTDPAVVPFVDFVDEGNPPPPPKRKNAGAPARRKTRARQKRDGGDGRPPEKRIRRQKPPDSFFRWWRRRGSNPNPDSSNSPESASKNAVEIRRLPSSGWTDLAVRCVDVGSAKVACSHVTPVIAAALVALEQGVPSAAAALLRSLLGDQEEQ